jgi:hypothetical protein
LSQNPSGFERPISVIERNHKQGSPVLCGTKAEIPPSPQPLSQERELAPAGPVMALRLSFKMSKNRERSAAEMRKCFRATDCFPLEHLLQCCSVIQVRRILAREIDGGIFINSPQNTRRAQLGKPGSEERNEQNAKSERRKGAKKAIYSFRFASLRPLPFAFIPPGEAVGRKNAKPVRND